MSGNGAFTTCRVDEGYPLFRYTAVSCNTTLKDFQAVHSTKLKRQGLHAGLTSSRGVVTRS